MRGMRSSELQMLAEVTRALTTRGADEGGLQAVAEAAMRLTGGTHASVRLRTGERELRVGARAGEGCARPAPGFDVGQGLLGWVAEHGRPANVADSASDPRFVPATGRPFTARSVLSVPILDGSRTLGVLSVSAPQASAFGGDDEAAASLLADATAQALITTELRRLAVTDEQTLAFNHRHLIPRLSEDIERARRTNGDLAVLLLDLDHFKRVNDRHGHAVGDAVLRAFADRVRESVRTVDALVRRGGEEFVVILPDTDLAYAGVVAERLRHSLVTRPLIVFGELTISQTVSIGIAAWDREESPASLDERADHAMYAAKSGGRNRVVVDSPGIRRRPSFVRRLAGARAAPKRRHLASRN